ncbi:MAG: hypothetical protein H0T62_00345 [Parachlamydiaceae bacterium]|nr:hypothetical protein [Parachlamydiaceae bacterium]
MVEPIEEDTLKRSKINQQYQDYYDQIDATDDKSEMSGNIEGRNVKNISSECSKLRDIFKRTF